MLVVVIFFVLGFLCAFSGPAENTWVEHTLKRLSLKDKIAQLVQIRVPGKFLNHSSEDFQSIANEIKQNHVGGVVLFAGNVYESIELLNDLQTMSKLPLLVAADFERGAAFRIADTTSFPWAMALGAGGSEQLAQQQGVVTARESRALGVHWIFAPVMDVNNNPSNPVINIRAFGEDPELVARLGSAFIRGAKSGGVLTTAKHFPGHGDTSTDSHIGLAVVPSNLTRLQSVELVPFRSAIDAGVDSIMTAHVSMPNVTGESQSPATLSSKILRDLLRDSLHFKGLVVTDALEMRGISNRYWSGLAAVRAIQAGADIILLPLNATVAIQEIERAVQRGDISESRIDESVRRILSAKNRLGLPQMRTVSAKRAGQVIASPESVKLAQNIADRSITVLKDEKKLLPVDPTHYDRILSLVLTPDLESSPGETFQTEMRHRFPFINTMWANARISDELLSSIDRAVSDADLIVCSTLIRLISGQAVSAIPDAQRKIFEKLQATGKPMVWVALGNPYILPLAPKIGTYLCTFSHSDVSQAAAARAIAGEIPVEGKMPVSIPGFAKAGDGLNIPTLDMTLQPLLPESSLQASAEFELSRNLLDSCIQEGIFPGAALLVGYRNRIVLTHAAGRVEYESNSPAASTDTVYSADSFSEPVGVLSAAMLAADAGDLLLNVPVQDYLPELTEKDIGNLDFGDMFRLTTAKGKKETRVPEEIFRSLLSRAVGSPMEQFLHNQVFRPLGMNNTGYRSPRGFHRGALLSLDSPIPDFATSASDLAIFAQTMLNRGAYAHHRYFKVGTVDRFTQAPGPWIKPSGSDWTGAVFSSKAFGHHSSSGSLLWVDPSRELFIVMLANGKPDDGKVLEARRKICESIVAALHE